MILLDPLKKEKHINATANKMDGITSEQVGFTPSVPPLNQYNIKSPYSNGVGAF
jgi:hypothetical protein